MYLCYGCQVEMRCLRIKGIYASPARNQGTVAEKKGGVLF